LYAVRPRMLLQLICVAASCCSWLASAHAWPYFILEKSTSSSHHSFFTKK